MDENKILDTIRTSGIKPISKRYFRTKRILTAGLGVLVTIMGAFVFAKILASLLASGWEYWDYVFNSLGSFIYFALPLLWIGLLVLFIFLMPFILERTGNGYKYKKIILVLFSILASIILGLIILKVGSYTGINKFLANSTERSEARLWLSPNNGRIVGSVTARSNESIIIQDFRNKIWVVDISKVLPASKTVAASSESVRILGIKLDENTFLACQVLPFDTLSKPTFNNEEVFNFKAKNKTQTAKDVCETVLREDL